MKVHRGADGGVVVTLTRAELLTVLCAFDAGIRNYQNVPHELNEPSARYMIESIEPLSAELERFQ
jgi:hypothetical protein